MHSGAKSGRAQHGLGARWERGLLSGVRVDTAERMLGAGGGARARRSPSGVSGRGGAATPRPSAA
eukprot:2642546-Pyramimonas_sp.AAC.1